MRYWWVNQNQTYKSEFSGGYMWSPSERSVEIDGRNHNDNYSHTQKAPLCLILYGSALACIVLAWIIGETAGIYIAGGVSLLVASLAPCFHHLTVVDQGDVLAVRFGPIPLFGRTVKYAEIKKVEIGRTLILDDWGIHLSIRGGWV